MLTKKQKEILDFVNDFIKGRDYSPSYEEIAKHFRLKSVATIHEHVENLKKQGYLTKDEKHPRTLGIQTIKLPLLGTIAAGSPIEAIEVKEEIEVEKSMVSNPKDHYALRVKGNSMIDEGIFDGDTVIIRRQETAENGEKVVAITKDGATLKKYYKEKNGYRLQPANPKIKPIFVKELEIRGKFVGALRNFEKKIDTPRSKTKNLDEFTNRTIEGDCLDVMKEIPAKSVDMILCDLPYGHTQNHWDSIIPLDKLWEQYERVIKDNGVMALTSQGLFTAKLILSNPKLFKYKITWIKSKPTNFLNARKQPLRKHEDICIFYKNQPDYNPQMTVGEPYNKGFRKNQLTGSYGDFSSVEVKSSGSRYPTDVVYFKTAEAEGHVYHPTQKPVELGRYLVRTFTKPGDVVMDNACGSGSFLVSAVLERREFIGIEKNKEVYLHRKNEIDYIEVCNQRIKEALKKQNLFSYMPE